MFIVVYLFIQAHIICHDNMFAAIYLAVGPL